MKLRPEGETGAAALNYDLKCMPAFRSPYRDAEGRYFCMGGAILRSPAAMPVSQIAINN